MSSTKPDNRASEASGVEKGASRRLRPPMSTLFNNLALFADDLFKDWPHDRRLVLKLTAMVGSAPVYRAGVAEIKTALAVYPELLAALVAIEGLTSSEIDARFGGHPSMSAEENGRNFAEFESLSILRNIARAAIGKATGGE